MPEPPAHSMLDFYKECLARAFRGRFREIEKWTASISLVGLALIAFRSSMTTETQRLLQVDVLVYFFIGAFLLTVVAGLVAAPYRIFAEERDKKLALENLRKPRLQVILPGPEPGGVATAGHTSETYGGRRVTVTTGWISQAIYLLCTNLGEVEAKRCRARVIYASRETDGAVKEAGIIESIELPWSKKEPEDHLNADIAPADTVRIWLARVQQDGSLWVFREKDELPINYQQIFGEQGRHKVLLQIDSANVAPTQVLLSIETEAAKRPEGSGIWMPKATVTMLGQGGPTLQHPEIPERLNDTPAGHP